MCAIKNDPNQISLKETVMSVVQNTLDGINSKLDTVGEKISEINDIAVSNRNFPKWNTEIKREKKIERVLVNFRAKLSGVYIYIHITSIKLIFVEHSI